MSVTRAYIDPHEHKQFLGATFVRKQDEVVLKIGVREWSRSAFVKRFGVAHIAAAGKLSTVLRKAKVQSMEQLYAIDPREFALIKGLGETTVFVAMAVLQAEGFNVSHWYGSMLDSRKRATTFRTMKVTSGRAKRRRGRRS